MKAYNSLPENYQAIYAVNLQKDKKIAVFINVLSLIIAALMLIPASFFVPLSSLFSMENGLINYSIRFACLLVLMILYMVLHELTHGIAMKICGTKKIKYGFTGLYAYAGSDDFYDKKSYIFIALAPVVLLGLILLIVNFFVSYEWFYVIYILQIINISGAAGDYFVSAKFSKMPKDILVKDYGIGMTVHSKIWYYKIKKGRCFHLPLILPYLAL